MADEKVKVEITVENGFRVDPSNAIVQAAAASMGLKPETVADLLTGGWVFTDKINHGRRWESADVQMHDYLHEKNFVGLNDFDIDRNQMALFTPDPAWMPTEFYPKTN